MGAGAEADSPIERLESWKGIAHYLRRGVRTVRRWEKQEGLPVHRHLHKSLGTVYANRSEVDAWLEGRQPRARPGRVLIAVLPFENLSGDPAQEYFADGLTEEMIGELGRFSPDSLGVIARTTMMQYKGRTRPVRTIATALNVDYVLEGSVRREGDQVRVNAQLIHGRDQTRLWGSTYEQSMRTILGVQRELARDIAREIHLQVAPAAHARIRGNTVDPRAYLAHLKGRHFLNAFTPESVRRSVDYFRRSIAADQRYAAAYASLAEAYERLPMWIDEPAEQTLPKALAAAEHARELDPSLPEAHASLGLIHANYLWDWPKADAHFRRALQLNPSCSPACQWYAEFLAEMNRIDDALTILEAAKAHDPLSLGITATFAFVSFMGRRFDEAIAQADQALEIDPDYPMALIRRGVASAAKGEYSDAVDALKLAEKAAPGLFDCIALQSHAYGLAGRRSQALKQRERLRRVAKRRYVPAFLFAMTHLGLGEQDEAIRLIEKEYEARGWYLLLIKQAPQFDPLRPHPRFQDLLRRMNFDR